MTITETTRVDQWLSSKLAALAAGGAWLDIAPQGTATPYIVYTLVASNDVSGVGAIRLWANSVWQILVVAEQSKMAAIESVCDAIETAIQLATGTQRDTTIMRVSREQVIAMGSVVNGIAWRRIGARWRIFNRKT